MSPARRKGYVLRYRVPHAAVGASGGPYAIAERIGRYSASWRWPAALSATAAAHALLALLAYLGDREHRLVPPKPQQVVTLERLSAEPPPPLPEPEPERPPPRPAPTAARAGKVVAATPEPGAPVDMTSFTMPVGTSDSYAGGFTAPGGSSAAAVPEPPPRARAGPSKARSAGPARRDWTCPWPEEEQSGDLHDVSVKLRVDVGADGRARTVDVLEGPRESFSQAARACALAEQFRPPLDDAGRPIAGLTPPFSVHFVR